MVTQLSRQFKVPGVQAAKT